MADVDRKPQVHHRLTVREIAKELGVSPSTVSRALDDHPRISSQTKALVKKTLVQMGKEMTAPEASTIGLFLMSDTKDSFFSSIIKGVMDFTDKMGMHLLLEKLDASQSLLPYAISRGKVDGAIVAGLPVSDDLVKGLASESLPVVFIGRYLNKRESLRLNSVLPDNNLGGQMAAEHLVEMGYQKFMVLAYAGPQYNPFSDRIEGFISSIGKGLDVEVFASDIKDGCLVGDALTAIIEYVHQGFRVGIFALADGIARACIRGLSNHGIDIPDNVGVVGYDGLEKASPQNHPTLTTLNVPREGLGYMAGRLLWEISNEDVPMPMQIYVQPQIVLGGSTGRSRRNE